MVEYAVIGVDVATERGKKIVSGLNNGIFPLVAEDPKIDQLFNIYINSNVTDLLVE